MRRKDAARIYRESMKNMHAIYVDHETTIPNPWSSLGEERLEFHIVIEKNTMLHRLAGELLGFRVTYLDLDPEGLDEVPFLDLGSNDHPIYYPVPDYTSEMGYAWDIVMAVRKLDQRSRSIFDDALVADEKDRWWEFVEPIDICKAGIVVCEYLRLGKI